MDTVAHETGSLVVGIDGSEAALQAARWAAREAAHRELSVHLVYSINLAELYTGVIPPTADVREALREEGSAQLRAAEQAVKQAADVEVATCLESDAPAVVLRDASRWAHMLIVGSSGGGAFGTALGSITLKLAGHAECPVIVVRGDTSAGRTRGLPVVVGVDGSSRSWPALAYGFQEASLHGSPLTAVHVWSDADAERMLRSTRDFVDWEPIREAEQRSLEQTLTGWTERYPDVEVERVVKRDNPKRVLSDLSERAQLVVVATRGRGGFSGLLLGSTSHALIHSSACPVMLIGPESYPAG
ncbi:universal stress protein [Haloechinothrix sp. YIM 98757]|uniref:Universal stress protein n=1 Tax=Haloechinothrix aidingensis TaxID=2752311 RepID=A0A838A7I5_9PSEU|nr:universal stress protein [Haloechinothrix aidingensis]MBA0124507.1 universal stress protein [Haloechinothrix aidingensis]